MEPYRCGRRGTGLLLVRHSGLGTFPTAQRTRKALVWPCPSYRAYAVGGSLTHMEASCRGPLLALLPPCMLLPGAEQPSKHPPANNAALTTHVTAYLYPCSTRAVWPRPALPLRHAPAPESRQRLRSRGYLAPYIGTTRFTHSPSQANPEEGVGLTGQGGLQKYEHNRRELIMGAFFKVGRARAADLVCFVLMYEKGGARGEQVHEWSAGRPLRESRWDRIYIAWYGAPPSSTSEAKGRALPSKRSNSSLSMDLYGLTVCLGSTPLPPSRRST